MASVEPMSADVRADLKKKAKALTSARAAEDVALKNLIQSIRLARAKGHGLEDIGDTVGVSKARIHQMVNGKR